MDNFMGTGGKCKHHPKFDRLSMSFEQGTGIHVAASYQFLSLPVLSTLFQQQNWLKENFKLPISFHIILVQSRFNYVILLKLKLKRCPSQRKIK